MPVACAVFPPDNPINQDISAGPVDPNSAGYIAGIGLSGHLHPDFGTDPSGGIRYTVVGPEQPVVPIHFTAYGDESDPGPYPVPPALRSKAPASAETSTLSPRHPLRLQQPRPQPPAHGSSPAPEGRL